MTITTHKSGALAYAARSWPVLPLWWITGDGQCACGDTDCRTPGKHPLSKLVPHGLHEATIDAQAIERWWTANPLANIGVVTGAESGFIAIDIDPRHGGDTTLNELVAKHGDLPDTVVQLTGGGGRHFLFQHPGRRVPTRQNVWPGIDIKGDGGYIVVEPSLHFSGKRYAWATSHRPGQTPIAPAPDWLREIIVDARSAPAQVVSNGDTFKFNPAMAQEVVIAKAALAALKPQRADDYHTWTSVGMILHSVDPGPMMLEVLDDWSKQSAKYREGECARKWATFNSNGSLNLPTLIRWAKEDQGGAFKVEAPTQAPATVSTSPPAIQQYRPFPVGALPEPLRGFVLEASSAVGCDAAFIAVPVLTAVMAAIGNTRRVRLRSSWVEPCVLWGMIVGSPGTMKSPAVELAVAPLHRLQGESVARYKEELGVYELEKARHDAEFKDWKKSKDRDSDNPPEAPAVPQLERMLVSDTTTEALAEVLVSSPRGVLLYRDELAGWLRGLDQYKGGHGSDCQQYLEMHRAGRLIVDRKTGQRRTIHVDRAAVSITGGIQPGTLKRILRPEFFENGMTARLLMAAPPRAEKKWSDKELTLAIQARYDALFDGLRALTFDMSSGEPEPIDIPLTDDAQAAYVTFYNELAREQAQAPDEVAGMLAKIEGCAARLALIIHIVRDEANDLTLEDSGAIDESSVMLAITLVRWFAQEAERVYAMLGETDEQSDRRRLIELIARHGGQVTPTELRRAVRAFRDSTDAAAAALQELVDAGHGQWQEVAPGPKGGRRTRRFVLTAQSDPDWGFSSRRHVDSSRFQIEKTGT
ncbi:MAG: hypothetical protein CMJ21_06240 [Phycisphaerae bacterium]|nr:hypothetical protein [Phycisphaerae bacterium]